MKKTVILRKLLALLLCLCLLTGCAATGSGELAPSQSGAEQGSSSSPVELTPEPPADNAHMADLHIWQTEIVETGLEQLAEGGFATQWTVGGQYFFAVGYHMDSTQELLRVGLDGSDPTVLLRPPLHQASDTVRVRIEQIAAAPDDSLWLIESVTYLGSHENDILDTVHYAHLLTSDGQPVTSFQLDTPDYCPLTNAPMVATADGTCLLDAEEYVMAITADGSCRSIAMPASDARWFTLSAADNAVAIQYSTADYTRYALLPDGTALPMPAETLNDRLVCGADGQPYIVDAYGLYALDSATGEKTLLCDLSNSGVNSFYDVQSLYAREDGSFIAVSRGPDFDTLRLIHLYPTDPATLPAKAVVTLGGAGLGSELLRHINDFNRTSDSVLVVVKDYAADASGLDARQLFAQDEQAGALPDILVRSDGLPFDSWAAEGRLLDLYPLLDADPGLSREDFWPTALAAAEVNGRLPAIFPVFSIATLAAAPDAAGAEPGWTWQQLANMLAAWPEARPFPSWDKAGFLWSAMIAMEPLFIDAASRTCDFENGEFLALLEFANTLPDSAGLEDDKALLTARKALLQDVTVSTFDRMRYLADEFGSAVTLKGYPTADGSCGSSFVPYPQLGITAASKNQAAAWLFIRYLLSAESQRAWRYGYLPLRKDVCQELMADALLDPPVRKGDREGTAYMRPCTDAEVQQVAQLIGDTRYLYRDLGNFQPVLQQAVQPYFNGEITVQQAAAAAQAAVSALLAEPE